MNTTDRINAYGPRPFITAAPATRPIPLAKALRPYRREAIAGINYAWGHGFVAPDDCDDAGRMTQDLPRSQAPAPVEREPISLVSKYGKRLPLRAIPFRDLNREIWSHGKTVFQTERSEPRELLAHEKQPEEMSIDELVATQSREPLSESRRSWLTRGAGVMSLEGISYDEGSIGETVAAQGVDLDTLIAEPTEFEVDEEHDAVRFGTPIELLDPITAKQIAWEQEQHGNSEVTRVRIAEGEAGLTFQTDRKLIPEAFVRLARSVKRTLAAELRGCTTLDEFHARIDLAQSALVDSGITRDFSSADPDEERERFMAPADLEWHTAYERVHPMIAILSEDWSLKRCNRHGCQTMEEHEHVRFAQAVHRRPQNVGSQDEFWRTRVFDPSAFELGTDGLVDPLVREFAR